MATDPEMFGRKDSISTRRVVVVSLVVDLFDIFSNLVVALLTGSAVIFAEMAQGIADAIGSMFLVVGERRARRPRDEQHPLGYAREVFFWALLSTMVMLFVGSGLAFMRGIRQLMEPEPLRNLWIALSVLLLSCLTNGYAFSQSYLRLKRGGGGIVQAFRGSGELLVNTAFLQDGLGTLSSILGLVALALYAAFDLILLDAVGALVAGCLMVVCSIVLSSQTREMIVGRSIPRRLQRALRLAVLEVPGVEAINRLLAVTVGSSDMRVEIDLDLSEELSTLQIEAVVDAVQHQIAAIIPTVSSVSIDLNSPR